jgi:hypothetical protein
MRKLDHLRRLQEVACQRVRLAQRCRHSEADAHKDADAEVTQIEAAVASPRKPAGRP